MHDDPQGPSCNAESEDGRLPRSQTSFEVGPALEEGAIVNVLRCGRNALRCGRNGEEPEFDGDARACLLVIEHARVAF